MRILVLNCGSSSLKFALFEMPEGEVISTGSVERIGAPQADAHWRGPHGASKQPLHAINHTEAVEWVATNVLADIPGDTIQGIGHRIVHGGETYSDSVCIDDEVENGIAELAALAPLHNLTHVEGIRAARNEFADQPQVAVFDTAFHQTLPEHAYRYAIPTTLYKDHRLRRYGFHGTSHRYVAERAAGVLGKLTFTGVTCHLGNGSSAAAIQDGKSVDTTMGLTPLAGIPMGTRSGDLDPALVLHLQEHLGYTPERVDTLLNRESGLLGLSGVSNDVREIEAAAAAGNAEAKLAIEVFCYQIAKAIGGFLSILTEADGVVFTGGIGENAQNVRKRIVEWLSGLSIQLDDRLNGAVSEQERIITCTESGLVAMVIPTREEWVIARDTHQLIQGD